MHPPGMLGDKPPVSPFSPARTSDRDAIFHRTVFIFHEGRSAAELREDTVFRFLRRRLQIRRGQNRPALTRFQNHRHPNSVCPPQYINPRLQSHSTPAGFVQSPHLAQPYEPAKIHTGVTCIHVLCDHRCVILHTKTVKWL